MKKKQLWGIAAVVLLGCAVMAAVDGLLRPPYWVKSGIKLLFFLLVPLLYCRFMGRISLKSLLFPGKRDFLGALLLGVCVYGLILGAYFVLRNFFDFSAITGLLAGNAGVNGGNFLWVSLYISLCNSLLEEFFFRGFAFLTLGRLAGRRTAYLFSSLSFAAYHIAMLAGWFSLPLFLLAMAGLAAGGCIFNYLDEKRGSILPSWMVHMFANFAINTVGFILFGMI